VLVINRLIMILRHPIPHMVDLEGDPAESLGDLLRVWPRREESAQWPPPHRHNKATVDVWGAMFIG
jgi:hypothetical protein